MKTSIIIPTYNHCEDLLKPCIESIIQFTDLSDVEIIISANGCTDNTAQYVESLAVYGRDKIRLVWSSKPLGFPKAINEGLKVLSDDTEYVVLFNNDNVLLPQNKNKWLEILKSLFSDAKTGIVGPLRLYDNYVKQYYIHFFCAMIKHEVIKKIGLLDEIFGDGNCEDTDFCIRAKLAGYKFAHIPIVFDKNTTMKLSDFPIFHIAHKTVWEIEGFKENAQKNLLILQERYKDLPPEDFEQEKYI